MTLHAVEVKKGFRFEFGANWLLFLNELNENRIAQAEQSLRSTLDINDLEGRSFLDIGSGSGLFSLAARRMGATVHSFDYDPQSVACTEELKRRYFPQDRQWMVEVGSALDHKYLSSLGQFDVVYSWGVLHHTGAMWNALENVLITISMNGLLFIAIYNDQGRATRMWKKIKKTYCSASQPFRGLILLLALIRLWGPTTIRDLVSGKPGRTWRNYGSGGRGMSPWRDVVDWVGGYPFETAKPEEIFEFYRRNGLQLERLKTCAGGHGCNEYVFSRAR